MATSACTWPRVVFTSGSPGSWRGGLVKAAVSLWRWAEMHLRSHGPGCTFQKALVQEMFPCQCDNCWGNIWRCLEIPGALALQGKRKACNKVN